MVPHGRGRGIRRVQEDKPVGLVRSNLQEGRGQEDGRLVDDPRFYDDVLRSPPGGEDSPIPPNFSTDDLLQLLEVGQDMRRITRSIKHLCSTEQTLREVVDEIHARSSQDLSFGKNAAKAFSHVSQLEVCGIKFRDVVLRCIQNDFKNRAELREGGEEGYLRAVNLLCEVFHNMRLADGTVINILSVPILEYFSSLLATPTLEAVTLIATQTHIIGEEVQRSKPDKFQDFLLRIRKLIVDPDIRLDEQARCGLLHILESHLLRWPSVLPEKVGDFYSSILGDRVLYRPNLFPIQPTHTRPNSQDGSQGEEEFQGHRHEDPGVRRNEHYGDPRRNEFSGGMRRDDQTGFGMGRDNQMGGGMRREEHMGGGVRREDHGMRRNGSEEDPGMRRIAHADPIPRTANYYRPPMNNGPAPRIFDTPPPNMMQNFAPPQGVLPPQQQSWNPALPTGRSRFPENPQLNGVERIAADMMAIHMPPMSQVSPPVRTGRSHGWQAMPPILPPSGPPPNIPTAIVPPGVPPHNRPINGYQDPSLGRTAPGIWNTTPANHSPAINPLPTRDVFQARPGGREHFDNAGYNRPGGSGRIISGSRGEQGVGSGSNSWGKPEPEEWNSRAGSNQEPGPGRQGFDIGTWENPAGGGGEEEEEEEDERGSENSSGDRKPTSWSTNDGTSSWSTGDDTQWGTQKQWDRGQGSDRSGGEQTVDIGHWGARESSVAPEKGEWGTRDTSATIDKGQWGTGDITAAPDKGQWVMGETSSAPELGKWGMGDTPAAPDKNQWGQSDTPDVGNWGTGETSGAPEKSQWGSTDTSEKVDWRNESVDSVSPGWKKEPVSMGNWADEVPSPRSDREETPNTSYEARKIVW